jgi:hypothetical protein
MSRQRRESGSTSEHSRSSSRRPLPANTHLRASTLYCTSASSCRICTSRRPTTPVNTSGAADVRRQRNDCPVTSVLARQSSACGVPSDTQHGAGGAAAAATTDMLLVRRLLLLPCAAARLASTPPARWWRVGWQQGWWSHLAMMMTASGIWIVADQKIENEVVDFTGSLQLRWLKHGGSCAGVCIPFVTTLSSHTLRSLCTLCSVLSRRAASHNSHHHHQIHHHQLHHTSAASQPQHAHARDPKSCR